MHAVRWFEIPALDLNRAFTFYHTVLNGNVRMGTFGGDPLILFNVPFQNGEAVGGSVVQRASMQPSANGPLIYLNAFAALSEAVSKVATAGGKVLVPFIDLGHFGFAAMILDSEGNTLGLLSHEK